jgi:hypothetical protein
MTSSLTVTKNLIITTMKGIKKEEIKRGKKREKGQ